MVKCQHPSNFHLLTLSSWDRFTQKTSHRGWCYMFEVWSQIPRWERTSEWFASKRATAGRPVSISEIWVASNVMSPCRLYEKCSSIDIPFAFVTCNLQINSWDIDFLSLWTTRLTSIITGLPSTVKWVKGNTLTGSKFQIPFGSRY